jgi:hypothetical protein
MKLTEKTLEIKSLTTDIKSNFIKIGEILTIIRNQSLYKPYFDSFNAYLLSNDFEFSRAHAYRLIAIHERCSVSKGDILSYNTLLQLANVPDKQIREDLIEEAHKIYSEPKETVRIREFQEKVHRSAQRTNNGLNCLNDSPKDKCLRLIRDLLSDIEDFKQAQADIQSRIDKVTTIAQKYTEKEVLDMKNALMEAWK